MGISGIAPEVPIFFYEFINKMPGTGTCHLNSSLPIRK